MYTYQLDYIIFLDQHHSNCQDHCVLVLVLCFAFTTSVIDSYCIGSLLLPIL